VWIEGVNRIRTVEDGPVAASYYNETLDPIQFKVFLLVVQKLLY
jgi:hypothetical protein